jgi:hypothetical protein
MKPINQCIPDGETIVAIIPFHGIMVIATQRCLYKVWQESGANVIEELKFNVVH